MKSFTLYFPEVQFPDWCCKQIKGPALESGSAPGRGGDSLSRSTAYFGCKPYTVMTWNKHESFLQDT